MVRVLNSFGVMVRVVVRVVDSFGVIVRVRVGIRVYINQRPLQFTCGLNDMIYNNNKNNNMANLAS